MNKPIALLTDFGLSDHYVGSIKSVILNINPKAVIYDLSHEVRPQNIREGAYLLNTIYPFLPKNTIVVAVVDPGVGSERTELCIKVKDKFLLGPNNGLLSLVLKNEKYEARRITNDRYFLKPVSSTFHGRDIFSPSAAQLSKRDIFSSLGPEVKEIEQIHFPQPTVNLKKIQGEIVYIDQFGNAMTNIKKNENDQLIVKARNQAVRFVPFFGAGKIGELIALWNSAQILELAVFRDSAEKLHGLKIGDSVEVSHS